MRNQKMLKLQELIILNYESVQISAEIFFKQR